MQVLITTFLILSGIAALAYQLVWVRLLGYTVGGTSAAVSTVLAAFFLGLALGNALAPRLLRRFAPLRLYASLEFLIGIAGLTSLYVLPDLGPLLGPVLGSSLLAKFLAAAAVLLIPTICMGATFPVLATVATQASGESRGNDTVAVGQLGSRLGQLYALNTLGAVIGAAASGFWWIPLWGLNGAVLIAASFNLIVAFMALAIAGRRVSTVREVIASDLPPAAKTPSAELPPPLRQKLLAVLAMTGMVSIGSEVGWSKYLAIFAGGTVFGFAMILIVVLVGISAGSWLMHRILPRLRQPVSALAVGLALLSLSLLTCRTLLSYLPSLLEFAHHASLSGTTRLLFKFFSVAAVLLPPTLLLGALFPLSLSLYCGNSSGVRDRLGPAYAMNTAFSVLGSVVAGFWVIPRFGTNILLTALALIVLPFAVLLLQRNSTPRIVAIVFATMAGCILMAWKAPGLRFQELVASVDYVHDTNAPQGAVPEFLFLREGKAGVISLTTFDQRYVRLQNNGLNESIIDREHPSVGPVAETLLGLVPVLLHEEPRSGFVVGWGGGATVRALQQTTLESMRVVELEEAVVDAVATLLGEQSGLDDPRLDLDIDDARFCLLTEDRRYDIIVSQPSHPWVAGAGTVFTREFFGIVQSRLNDGGIFGQWLNLFNMDVATLCSIQNTFFSVFTNGFTFMDLENGDYLMFGSDAPLSLDSAVLNSRWGRLQNHVLENCCDAESATGVLRFFALSRRQVLEHCGNSPLNTDLNLRSEMRLASLSYERLQQRRPSENPYEFLGEAARFDLHPYLSDDGKQTLMTIGSQAIAKGDRGMVRRVIHSLELSSPDLADSLRNQLTTRLRVRATSP